MDKLILTVPRTNHLYGFMKQERPVEFFQDLAEQTPVPMDRAEAEENTDYLQLIPYVVVGTAAENGYCVVNLVGERLRGGNESRLHNKLTIGFGGHVKWQEGASIQTMLEDTAMTELQEELGLSVQPNQLQPLGFLRNDLDRVGKSHFGVAYFYDVFRYGQQQEINYQAEPEKLNIVMAQTIQASTQFDRFEAWSQILLSSLLSGPIASPRV